MPELTAEAIRRYVGDTSFQRGQDYFANGMVVHMRRVGDTLKADCHGSRATPYRVSASVKDGTIVEASCSCPVGAHCKHIAALLLTWLHQPDDFIEVEATHAALEKRSKAELVALIEQMLLRNPELESLLEMPLPTGEKKQPVNPKVYQRQAAAAFDDAGDEWGVEDDIARELEAMLDLARQFFAQADPLNAAAIYQAVTDEVLKHYAEYQDENGTLGGVVNDCVRGLGECLPIINDSNAREQIVRSLFDVYRFDVNFGGVGLSDEGPDLIVQHATADERQQVVEWVREAMKARTGDDWGSNWRREVYGKFLIELQQNELDDEAYLKLCRESHRLNDLVNKLLELGRVGEATREAKQAEDNELVQMADIFVQHQRADIAEQLMTQRARKTDDRRIIAWLKERCETKGDLAGALAWARKLFAEHGSLEQYQEMRSLATALQTWPTVCAELLAELEQKKQWGLLTKIYLNEQEIDAALQSVKRIREAPFGSWYYGSDLAIEVAQAAEATRPREALQLYVRRVERLIEQRGRDNYQTACQHLLRVRHLYQQLGEAQAWQQYLAKLQEQHKSLRALKEEMGKAKLVSG